MWEEEAECEDPGWDRGGGVGAGVRMAERLSKPGKDTCLGS